MYMLGNTFLPDMHSPLRENDQKKLAIICLHNILGLKVLMGNSKSVKVVHQLEYLVSVEDTPQYYNYICRHNIISTAYHSGGCN